MKHEIFDRDVRGEMVSPNDPGYDLLITAIFDTMKTATEMNTGCRTPEEVHEFMGRILDKPLDESTTVLPPLYIDYGKPVTIGKRCFIQQCCTFFGRGGIEIGDDVFIGCNTNLIAPVTLGDACDTAQPTASPSRLKIRSGSASTPPSSPASPSVTAASSAQIQL